MARTARRELSACIGVFLSVLVLAPGALADPIVRPIAGGGAGGDAADANAASLSNPQQVAVPHDFDYSYREWLIADYDHCKVRIVGYNDAQAESDIGTINTAVGSTCGDNGFPVPGTAGTAYKLDHPSSVSATPDDQVLIADQRNGRVIRWSQRTVTGNTIINQTADTVMLVAGTKVDTGANEHCAVPTDNTYAGAAKFCDLWRVAAHPNADDRRFLVVDDGCAANTGLCGAQAVLPHVYEVFWNPAGNPSPGFQIKTAAVGCATANTSNCFINPSGVAYTNNNDEFVVADRDDNKILRYDFAMQGSVGQRVAGGGNAADGGDGGLATDATLAEPSDVVMTGDGGYYIADTFNCRIRKVTDLTAQALIFSIGGMCGDGLPDQTPHSAFDEDLWPSGLGLGPAGLYVTDFKSNQVKLFDRTTITAAPPQYTNQTRSNFTVESLETYGPYVCNWSTAYNSNSDVFTYFGEDQCGTTDGPTPTLIPPGNQTALNDGLHDFYACTAPDPRPDVSATWTPNCSYGDGDDTLADPTPAHYQWTVDTSPPTGLALTAPADGASEQPPSPSFGWHAADSGLAPMDHYELWIDDGKDRDVPVSACTVTTCTATPAAALSEATHKWRVRAVDAAGNTVDTADRTLSSGSAPVAAFTIAPNPVLAGRAVTFDASGSADANGPIARYEWDLDGDGSFETDGASSPQATKTYTSGGSVTVQLRVTDGVGKTNVTSGVVTVTVGTIAGQLGVTINNGAQYTNKPDVTLSIAAPASVTQLLVSNDGGFLAPSPFPPAKQVAWHLDSSGPERLPKTVYVRFVQGAFTSPNYTDDIILDERPPVVDQASLAPAAAAARASAAQLRTWKLKVKARDSNSGVGGVQVAINKSKPGKLIPYKTRLKVKLAKRPKFLRARDRAGNYSRWKKLR